MALAHVAVNVPKEVVQLVKGKVASVLEVKNPPEVRCGSEREGESARARERERRKGKRIGAEKIGLERRE